MKNLTNEQRKQLKEIFDDKCLTSAIWELADIWEKKVLSVAPITQDHQVHLGNQLNMIYDLKIVAHDIHNKKFSYRKAK